MARGFKIADAYVELTVDRDAARQGVRDLPREVGPDADRAGRAIGDKVGQGLAAAVQSWSAKVAKARRAEVDAANAVQLAELRLNEARKRGVSEGSAALLALTQKLEKSQYRLAQAHREVTTATGQHAEAQRRLSADIADMADKAGPEADRGGRDLGNKLSQGIHLSIVRNSPLIVAGIAAALAVGAPLMTGAAVTLMAGIGIVAAAQSQNVRQAWLGTWQSIKAGAIADARPIEAVLIGLAGRVGASFERLRPSLRDAFAAVGPHIDVLADALLGMAEDIVPALTRSVQGAGPVVNGLAKFIESTGVGFAKFFDILTAHSPAAGKAFASLGDIMGHLLPILGELLGQGAELAAVVLPPLAQILGVVAAALERLGPILPTVAAGLMALKIAQTATGWLGSLSASLLDVANKGGLFSGAAGKASGALGMLSRAAGPVGAVIGIAAAAMAHGKQQADEYATAMLKGGAAADQAFGDAQRNTIIEALAGKIGGLGAVLSMWTSNSDEAAEAQRKLWASMSPAEQIQSKVAYWTAELSQRLKDESSSTAEVEAAKRRLAHWQQESARLAEAEERAIRGVTEAMAEQVDQSRSLVDSQFAYENAVNGVEDAQQALNEAIKEHGAGSEEAQRATLGLNEALSRQAQAAREVAESNLPAAMDDSQRAILGAKAELDELNRIAQQYTLPPELEAHRQKLAAITGQADGAMLAQAQLSAAVGELGFAVRALPGSKSIVIEAPTDALRAKLAELGFTIVELPNGEIEVTAETDLAKANLGLLNTLLAGLNNTTAIPKAELDDTGFSGTFPGVMSKVQELHGQRPTPVAGMNIAPLQGSTQTSFGLLDVLGAQRPTPVGQLNYAPLHTGVLNAAGDLGWLGGQRPTPVAQLNAGPFTGNANWVSSTMGWLNRHRANPLVTAQASIANAERHLAWVARNRTVTIWTNTITDRKAGGPVIGAAGGRKVVGPGGPTDDLVPAVGPGGAMYRLSNTEWIINALVSRQQGDRKMAALNAGLADIVLRDRDRERVAPGPAPLPSTGRGFADGGIPGRTMPETVHPDRTVTTAPGRTITVEHVSIHIDGTFDLASSTDLRKAAQKFREILIDLERETS